MVFILTGGEINMFDIVNSEISDELNKKLINIMYNYCDAFSFHLTNNFKTCRSIEGLSESDGNKYLKYKNNLLPIINEFSNYVLTNYKSLDYLGFHYYNKLEVYVIKFNKYTKDILIKSKGILSWKFPNMPDDLCFFSNGVCLLRSVAHENLIFLYTKDEALKKKLTDAGFILQRSLDEIAPKITY